MNIKVNNKTFEAVAGETLLDVLNRNGIKIPTLCHIKDMFPSGACRMCVVENVKTGKLVTSCSYPVEEGMEIYTHSPRVVESRKVIVELLLSNHPDDCLYCVRNTNCELQSLSRQHGVFERRIRGKKNNYNQDNSSPSISRDPDKCILCGRCVRVCESIIGVSAIDITHRGSNSRVGTAFEKGLNISSCVNCGQCIMVCPTGALTEKKHFAEILDAINDPNKTVVAQYAPAITVSLAEEFGLPPGTDINGLVNAALRLIGFDRVFDTSFGADLTIMEESEELIHRITNKGKLPLITSCCPSWVKYAEEFAPDFLDNISTCKSPQQMVGAIIKSYFAQNEGIEPENIYSASIMPCTAKKFEAQRDEMTRNGISDVDAVLTTREFVQLIHQFGIDMNNIQPQTTDSPLGTRTTAGKLFGATGGVMEAAIRTTYWKLTGEELINFQIPEIRGFEKRKETRLNINGLEIGVAVVNGLANAKLLLEEIRNGRSDIQFIEIMACPGGCIGGGGQLIGYDHEAKAARMQSLYNIDEKENIKVSHKNPEISELYNKLLKKPLSKKSHELLHTSYKMREVPL